MIIVPAALHMLVPGGWWKVSKFAELHGSIAVEYGEQIFVQALDNGLFKCGNSHGLGN